MDENLVEENRRQDKIANPDGGAGAEDDVENTGRWYGETPKQKPHNSFY